MGRQAWLRGPEQHHAEAAGWLGAAGVASGEEMRRHGLSGIRLRRRVKTTIPDQAGRKYPNLLKRNFTAETPDTAARDRGLAGAVFHSYHGSAYTSKDYARLCGQLGVTQSMGAIGFSADNALAGSFIATLKRELLASAPTFPDQATAHRAVSR